MILWIISWPVWIGLRSESILSLFLLLVALELIAFDRHMVAAFVIGLGILAQVEFALLIPVLALSQESRWKFVCASLVPGLIWIVIAATTYNGISLPSIATSSNWIDVLWLAVFFTICLACTQKNLPMVFWYLVLWASIETAQSLFNTATVPPANSVALGLVIALGLVSLLQFRAVIIITVLSGLLLLITPPKQPDNLLYDWQTGLKSGHPAGTSIAHDRSYALMPFHNNTMFALDFCCSAMWLIEIVPDYVYLSDESQATNLFENPALAPLRYELIHSNLNLWQRQATVSDFQPAQPIHINYRPDVQLVSWSTDKMRVEPGNAVRLRLDWQLDQQPKQPVGLNLSLIDFDGNMITNVQTQTEASLWADETLSTYHAFHIPLEAAHGIANIRLSVEYQAGLLGEYNIGTIAISPLPSQNTPTQNIDELGDVILYDAEVTVVDNTLLEISLNWGVNQAIEQDYTIFAHLIPEGETVPTAQSDSPPQAGRFPTRFWLPGDVITDQRTIDISEQAPGTYHLYVGMYGADGVRLQSATSDSIKVATIRIDDNRSWWLNNPMY